MSSQQSTQRQDDEELRALGYVPSFRREFSNLSTISFAFSVMGLCSSIATTLNAPLLLGGPASVTWCWFLGATNCLALSSSICEVVSAYPTCGALYGASARLCPKRYRARMGWIVGWLNILAQIVGLSSTEYGLATMILAAVYVSTNGGISITPGKVVGLTAGLLFIHGMLNSLNTRRLAYFATPFVFINMGATFLIIVLLLAMTPVSDMHSPSYVFGTEGVINGTGGWNGGISFLLGLLSVQWTMTGYDCTAHISEELRHPAYSAPAAIMMSTIGTGIVGWLLNIVLMLCSGPFAELPGPSGSAFLAIMVLRLGPRLAVGLWVFVCITAFSVAQVGVQAGSRTFYAFSRDRGLPDGGFFGHISTTTRTPLRTVWLTTSLSVLPALLRLASPIAVDAVFSMTAIAADLSYVIPIILRRMFHSHPEVMFKPGPYYMGDGWLGAFANVWCALWTFFACVILALPAQIPITPSNMNYASVITVAVVALSGLWYVLGAHRHYHGAVSNVSSEGNDGASVGDDVFEKTGKEEA